MSQHRVSTVYEKEGRSYANEILLNKICIH